MPRPLLNPLARAGRATHIPLAGRRFDAPSPLRIWHLASFDAPTVAVIWSLAFARAASVRLPFWVPALLFLAAWTVYIADRLLDARSALLAFDVSGLRERHLFHHRHRRLFAPLAIAAGCAAASIMFTLMPEPFRERNSVLGIAALAYFSRVHSTERSSSEWFLSRMPSRISPLFKKELLVGILFTSGCALPVFSRVVAQGSMAKFPLSIAAVFYALLAWLNCHAIDRWESDPSTTEFRISRPGCFLALAGLVVACFLEPRPAALLLAGAGSALSLALLDHFRTRLTPLALRAAADMVLLTPLILLISPILQTR